jgi:hypothetical protein
METLKTIRMVTAGPNGNYRVGALIQCDPERARILVDGGWAVYDTRDAFETATLRPDENMARRSEAE